MMDPEEERKSDSPNEKEEEEEEQNGMNGSAEGEEGFQGDMDAEEEDWSTPDPQPSIRYFKTHHRLLPSPGALALHGQRIALSVSSLTGRFWRGAVAVAPLPSTEDDPLIDIEAICELPSSIGDLRFVGQHSEKIITGHDDGCVSLLGMEEDEEGSKRLLPVTFAVEHDAVVRRVSVGSDCDLAASLDEKGCVRVWMLEPFLSVHSFTAFPFAGGDLALHPRRRNLLAAAGNQSGASGGDAPSLSLWDLRETDSSTTAKPHGGVASAEDGQAFSALAWSTVDDDWLFAGDRASQVHLFDLRSLKEPLVTRRGVHGSWAVERMAVHGARVLSTALDRRTAVTEVFAEEGGLARLRDVPSAVFSHASGCQGLAVEPKGDSWWTTELSGNIWRHNAGHGSCKVRLNPPLQEMKF